MDGRTDWASIKTKYFIASIIPENKGIYGSFKSENQLFGERKVTPGYKIYIGHHSNDKKLSGKIINVGSGKSISLNYLGKKIQSIIKQGKVIFKNKNKTKSLSQFSSIDLILKNTNWKPKVTLNEGLMKTINDFKK